MLTKKHKKARLVEISKWLTGTKQPSVMRRDFPLLVLIAGTHMLKVMKETSDKFGNIEVAVS